MKLKKFASLFLALVMVCSLSVSVFASPFDVGLTSVAVIGEAPYPTLQKAVDAAVDGNTIDLLINTPDESEVIVSKEITISSHSHLITNGVSAGDGYTMSISEDGLTYTFTRDSSGTTLPSSSNETVVTYTGVGTESYTVTVPASLTPGESGDVSVSGTWATNRKLTVTAPSTVTLTNSINSSDTKTLAVTFDGIEVTGDNTVGVSETKTITIADISDALFGTWSGVISYTVSMGNAA